jgi:hypothetical protein
LRRRAFLTLASALAMAGCARREPIEFRDGEYLAHDVTGPEPPQGWAGVFSVRVGPGESPPMLGVYRLEGSTLHFRPRFEPDSGLSVFATLSQAGGQPIVRAFAPKVAKPSKDALSVVSISPASDVLPENLLRIYVEFSEPMARGQAYQHLDIVDDGGQAVDHAFVEIDQDLWDPAGRRLTILFDPGRIKRGVKPNLDIGAPLIVGRRYGLVVRKGWQSAAGASLPRDVVKSFMAGPAERRPIVLADWKVAPPKAGSRDPLVIDFGRPLDDALLADCLHLQQHGETVVGKVGVENQATRWTFTPDQPWRAGGHDLIIETRLEDLAGNRIGRAFDVDTIASPQARITRTVERLTFEVD